MSISPWLRSALHIAQLAFWKATRLMLLTWGALNGLGIGLAGRVEKVTQRISRRVARVSDSFSASNHREAH